jgi:hypothetical protein
VLAGRFLPHKIDICADVPPALVFDSSPLRERLHVATTDPMNVASMVSAALSAAADRLEAMDPSLLEDRCVCSHCHVSVKVNHPCS